MRLYAILFSVIPLACFPALAAPGGPSSDTETNAKTATPIRAGISQAKSPTPTQMDGRRGFASGGKDSPAAPTKKGKPKRATQVPANNPTAISPTPRRETHATAGMETPHSITPGSGRDTGDNIAQEGHPRATMLLYRPAEQKGHFVFATKPAPEDRKVAPPVPDTAVTARSIDYSERDIIPVRTRLRYTTVIQLPAGEQIMDIIIGDKDFWVVNGAANLAYIKPAKALAATNLNLVSTRGIIYSFLLAEVGDGAPDLKIFVQPRDEALRLALNSPAKYLPVERVDDYRQQAEIARNQVREAKQAAQNAIDSQVSAFRSTYPASVRFGYRFERGKKPFDVTEIFSDGKFTYIKAHPEETPTLYEVKDGTPSLVNFDYKDGTYVVGKVLDSGYLAIGKKRFIFTREQ